MRICVIPEHSGYNTLARSKHGAGGHEGGVGDMLRSQENEKTTLSVRRFAKNCKPYAIENQTSQLFSIIAKPKLVHKRQTTGNAGRCDTT